VVFFLFFFIFNFFIFSLYIGKKMSYKVFVASALRALLILFKQ
jgi:hypothetical protein